MIDVQKMVVSCGSKAKPDGVVHMNHKQINAGHSQTTSRVLQSYNWATKLIEAHLHASLDHAS